MQKSAMPNSRFIRVSLVVYTLAILAFTLLKTMLTIGGLWKTGVHRTRSIELIPFHDFFRVNDLFNPIFNTLGNLALFVPFGVLLGLLWRDDARLIRRIAKVGFFFSLVIEVIQFVLGIGYSDVGDLLLNTVGSVVGAWIITKIPHGFYRPLVWMCLVLAGIAAFLLLGVWPFIVGLLH